MSVKGPRLNTFFNFLFSASKSSVLIEEQSEFFLALLHD